MTDAQSPAAPEAQTPPEEPKREPLTIETVRGWWEEASRQRPLPDDAACVRLAALVEQCLSAPGHTDRRSGPTELTKARRLLMERLPAINERWRQAEAESVTDASFIVERLTDLDRALRNVAPDWLEDQRTVKDLRWQALGKFLYPKIAREWSRAGHDVAAPHGSSPPVVFLTRALEYLGEKKTSGAVSGMLRDADAAAKKFGYISPLDPAEGRPEVDPELLAGVEALLRLDDLPTPDPGPFTTFTI